MPLPLENVLNCFRGYSRVTQEPTLLFGQLVPTGEWQQHFAVLNTPMFEALWWHIAVGPCKTGTGMVGHKSLLSRLGCALEQGPYLPSIPLPCQALVPLLIPCHMPLTPKESIPVQLPGSAVLILSLHFWNTLQILTLSLFSTVLSCFYFYLYSWRFCCYFFVGSRTDLSLTEGACSCSVLRALLCSACIQVFAVFQKCKCYCVVSDENLSSLSNLSVAESFGVARNPKNLHL